MKFIKLSISGALLAMSLSSNVFAKTCELSIDSTDAMKYSTDTLSVESDCTEVKLTLKHTGKLPKAAMGHNWVLTKTADVQAVVAASLKAGLAANYVPKGDDKVIAATKLLGGGESDTITFKLDKLKQADAYTFFCSFPGHSAIMKGTFTIKKPAA